MKSKTWLTIGAFVFFALIFIFMLSKTTNSNSLPGYAKSSQEIMDAYNFAVSSPEALNGVPCSCGCMKMPHNGRIHERGLLDCFRIGDNSFEKHGSQCDMCIKAALDVKNMVNKGMDKGNIKQAIIAEYGGI